MIDESLDLQGLRTLSKAVNTRTLRRTPVKHWRHSVVKFKGIADVLDCVSPCAKPKARSRQRASLIRCRGHRLLIETCNLKYVSVLRSVCIEEEDLHDCAQS